MEKCTMAHQSKRDYLRSMYPRYAPAPPESEGGHVRALEDEGCSDQSDKPKDPEQNARGQLNGKHGILDDLFCLVKQSEDELAFSFSLTKVYRRGN